MHQRRSLATVNGNWVVKGREEGVDVDSFEEADMAESNPVLSQSVGRDQDQLAFDVFI